MARSLGLPTHTPGRWPRHSGRHFGVHQLRGHLGGHSCLDNLTWGFMGTLGTVSLCALNHGENSVETSKTAHRGMVPNMVMK